VPKKAGRAERAACHPRCFYTKFYTKSISSLKR
jgi:predicted nucleic-acid-binding Zn-ribbon protein